jgi:hypothetical protein
MAMLVRSSFIGFSSHEAPKKLEAFPIMRHLEQSAASAGMSKYVQSRCPNALVQKMGVLH